MVQYGMDGSIGWFPRIVPTYLVQYLQVVQLTECSSHQVRISRTDGRTLQGDVQGEWGDEDQGVRSRK